MKLKKVGLLFGSILCVTALASCDKISDNFLSLDYDYVDEEEKTYTVTFNTNGGSSISELNVKEKTTAVEPKNPTKDGYTFDGWYKDSALEYKFDFNNTMINNNITLYAKWIDDSVATYTVTFNTNGGSSVSDITVEENGYATKPSNPTKSGYTFAGWYTTSSLTTEFNFSTTKITKDTTLYEKWTADVTTYTVTFNTNGGSTVSNITVEENGYATKPSNPTKNGYTFAGWYTTSSLTTEFNFTTTKITSNKTLYAKWTADVTTYTVTFNSESGTSVSSKTVNEGSYISAPTAPTRTGCIFAGWYTSYTYTYTTKFDFSTTKITKDTTLYAKWILNSSYSITMTSTSKVVDNGVYIYKKMVNNTGFDIYYLENVNCTVVDISNDYVCAKASFGDVKPTGYFKKGTTIEKWEFFFNTTCCNLSYWNNNSFTYRDSFNYNIVVLPNELK